jgi:general secretion pathway protein C
MSKYYYIAVAAVGILLIIAFMLLSYIDKKILDPATSLSEDPTADLSPESGKEPYQVLSSKKYDDSSKEMVPPSTKPIKGKKQPPPSINLRLVGTTVFGEKSSVILEDLSKGTQGVYRLGDMIQGFTITTILNDSVTLTKQEQELVLMLASGGNSPLSDQFFKKVGENSWKVSADKITDMVSNIDQYVGQVIAYQHRENGKPAGFRIRHLKEGNDFEKMGINSEDIIKKVNGLDVNDLTSVVKAVYQLSGDTNFTVEVERDNQEKTLNYQLDKNVNALVPIISGMFKMPFNPMGGE